MNHIVTQETAEIIDAEPVQNHQAPVDPMINMIERVVMSPDVPMDRVTALFDLKERQMNKHAVQAFNEAFARAMSEMPDVPRTGRNKHLKRSYATLDDLIRTARPVLSRHGLSLNWQTGVEADAIWVRAIVRHSLGHSIETEQKGPRDKSGSMNALQGGGSTETYLKRYTGFAILGLSSGDETDDDGQGASPASTISAEQFIKLRDMIATIGVDEKLIFQAECISSLETLPADRFPAVVENLKVTAKQRGVEL